MPGLADSLINIVLPIKDNFNNIIVVIISKPKFSYYLTLK
ncbi:hypothetical protein A1OE_408 [Candidatus Endolissoclinum faulkneri L2]|uniref:Uncharacterized protein n=1 Tax=Candidatus Endolissoclinum faulkneri L2 TaxID=1193729 RepID=K7YM69_9PROT|nr:hypothetical protein A1OE_408 [Candidatus Endolissoclinum faulkneri L2]